MTINIPLISRHLDLGNLNLVIQSLEKSIGEISLSAELSANLYRELRNISSTYLYMVKYAIEGMPDPGRNELRLELTDRLYLLAYAVQGLEKQSRQSTSSLYNISLESVSSLSLSEEVNKFLNFRRRASYAESDPGMQTTLWQRSEGSLKNIFYKVWTGFPVDEDTYNFISGLLADEDLPVELRVALTSALTLLLTGVYDSRAMQLLLEGYGRSVDEQVRASALTGAVIALLTHGNVVAHDRMVQKLLQGLRATADYRHDVSEVIQNLAATRETENIGRAINDEILPEIQRSRADLVSGLQEHLKNGDVEGLEENPEWERLLSESALGDKLRQLSDWQMQGADVMMTTFGQLKRSSFFRSPENWFLPFDARRLPQYDMLKEVVEKLLPMLSVDGGMCDSDKYSFFLAMAQMPQMQREMIASQLDAQMEQMREEIESSLEASMVKDMDKAVCRTVRNIFRFFRQFERRSEFADPFGMSFAPEALRGIFGEGEDVPLHHTLAEFFMTRGFYADAAMLYRSLAEEAEEQEQEQYLQKLGYCLQKSSDYKGALACYTRAEMLNGDSRWLLRQIAFCHKRLGNYADAARYYELLMQTDPDNTGAILNLANCLLETGEYEKALKLYYKADYLEPDKLRIIRPMAWCLMMMGRTEQSAEKYRKIMEIGPTASDMMAYGHLRLRQGDMRGAVEEYVRSIKADANSYSRFLSAFRNDAPLLSRSGIDEDLLSLVPDSVYFGLKGMIRS